MTIEEKIIDYINEELSATDRAEVEQLIKDDISVKALHNEYVLLNDLIKDDSGTYPDDQWVSDVSRQLAATASVPKVVNMWSQPVYSKIAAAAAIIIIGLLGYNNWRQGDMLDRVDEDLYALRMQMESNLEQSSVSTRIKAVRFSNQMDTHNADIVTILEKTLHEDPSSHVRLAAGEALRKWVDNKSVQESVIAALYTEKDPSVQILLIEILSSVSDHEAVSPLDYLIEDEDTPRYVKDEAHKAKFSVANNLKIY